MPEVDMQTFSAMLAHQQGHTINMMRGLPRQFHEAWQASIIEVKSAGKGVPVATACKASSDADEGQGTSHQHAELQAELLAYLMSGVHPNAEQRAASTGEQGANLVLRTMSSFVGAAGEINEFSAARFMPSSLRAQLVHAHLVASMRRRERVRSDEGGDTTI